MIGQFDQRITFERATTAADGIGGVTETWASLPTNPTVWARIMPKRQAEGMTGDRMTATAMVSVRIRYRDDLTEKDRFDWGGVKYNLRGILRASTRDQYLDLEAERGVAS